MPSTVFQPIATGGVNQQPVTSYIYENIGVNIDITPRTHHNDDVSLALKVEVSAISGEGYGGLPTFGNRSVNTIIRLRDGETSVLAGLIRDEERTSLDGIPGLSDIPFIGRLFAHNKTERIESDIIITLTPHIVRVLDLTEVDLRPFRVGRDTGGPDPRPARAAIETSRRPRCRSPSSSDRAGTGDSGLGIRLKRYPPLPEGGEQLRVDAAESAVRHHDDEVPVANLPRQQVDDAADVRHESRAFRPADTRSSTSRSGDRRSSGGSSAR